MDGESPSVSPDLPRHIRTGKRRTIRRKRQTSPAAGGAGQDGLLGNDGCCSSAGSRRSRLSGGHASDPIAYLNSGSAGGPAWPGNRAGPDSVRILPGARGVAAARRGHLAGGYRSTGNLRIYSQHHLGERAASRGKAEPVASHRLQRSTELRLVQTIPLPVVAGVRLALHWWLRRDGECRGQQLQLPV